MDAHGPAKTQVQILLLNVTFRCNWRLCHGIYDIANCYELAKRAEARVQTKDNYARKAFQHCRNRIEKIIAAQSSWSCPFIATSIRQTNIVFCVARAAAGTHCGILACWLVQSARSGEITCARHQTVQALRAYFYVTSAGVAVDF